jgi:hypothetical protein
MVLSWASKFVFAKYVISWWISVALLSRSFVTEGRMPLLRPSVVPAAGQFQAVPRFSDIAVKSTQPYIRVEGTCS